MKKLQNALKSYFNFTKGESHAVLLLLFIMTALLLLPHFFKRDNVVYNGDFTKLYQLADSLNRVEYHPQKNQDNKSYSVFEKPVLKGRNFNPNTISSEELLSMGLPKKLAERIVNYRLKVSPFLRKSDLKKVYGVDETLFSQLSVFIQLPEESTPIASAIKKSDAKKTQEFFAVDLNTVDTNGLIALPGIGSKLALRIVKYRDKLGGFVDLEQLKEVWGLKEEVLNLNRTNWSINPRYVQLIDVNSCGVEQLGKHPYGDFKMAKIIVAYRQQHGRFNSFEDLKKLIGVDAEKLMKLKPYLQF